MTAAEESVRAGRLDEALADLQGQVRKKPADARLRTFLFQLLAVRGEWDRALTQLKVAAELDPSAMAMAKTYQEFCAARPRGRASSPGSAPPCRSETRANGWR